MSTAQFTPERKKGLALFSAALTPFFLFWCSSAVSTDRDSLTGLTHNTATNELIETHGASMSSSQQGFSIKVFTSPDDQFSVSSVVVEGDDEVMLVDAQLTKTSAEEVLQEIKETKKPLSIIYITHEHADHFLGLEVFKGAYPGVRIIATSAVVDRINKVYREKLDKWQAILGSGASSQVVEISKFDGSYIDFEGSRIHVYTAETDTKARAKWLDALRKIRELKPSVVVPGHSKVGAALDASTAVDFTERYLLVFKEELKTAKDPVGLINAMKEKFPSAGLLLALERGAKANVERRQAN